MGTVTGPRKLLPSGVPNAMSCGNKISGQVMVIGMMAAVFQIPKDSDLPTKLAVLSCNWTGARNSSRSTITIIWRSSRPLAREISYGGMPSEQCWLKFNSHDATLGSLQHLHFYPDG